MPKFDKNGRLRVFVEGVNITVSGGMGQGDVVGPTTASNNAVVVFSGTTGKAIKQSTANISDNGTLHVRVNGANFSSPYALSVQNNSPTSYIEILNNDGAGVGAFFGMEPGQTANDDFSLYNWQAGPITFYTSPIPSSGSLRFVIRQDGDVEVKNLTTGVMYSEADGTLRNSNAQITPTGFLSLPVGLNVTGTLNVLGTLSASVGGDLTGSLPNLRVIGFTSGSTQITYGNLLDGGVLIRSSNTITTTTSGNLTPLATTLPVAVSRSVAAIGTSLRVARADHKHDIFTGVPSTLTPDLSNFEGNSESLSRSDHIHNIPAETPVSLSLGGTNTEGIAASFARSDHVHRVTVFSQEVRESSNITTSFTTPQIATGMTITPGAGTYLIFFSAWGDHDNNNATLSIGISINGTLINESKRRTGGTSNSDNDKRGLATQAIATITAGQAIQGVYWRSTGGGNVDLADRILTVVRLDT